MGATNNYSDNKKGWVTFKGGKKKVKLRAYLADLVSKIQPHTDAPRAEIREMLITYYNKDGLKGMHRACNIYLSGK